MGDSSVQVIDEAVPAEATFRSSLVRTPEGRLLLLGAGLAVLYFAWIAVSGLFSESKPHELLAMTFTEVVFGRAAALAVGYASEMGQATVIAVSMIVETLLVLIFYPLFVFSWNRLLVVKRLQEMFRRIRAAAETHKDKVERYGVVGVFVFVWLPFWMTGPVVGSVIGFLLGLRAWVNMTAVLAGTYVAILGWALFLWKFQEQLDAYGRYAGAAVVIGIVCFFFFMQRVHRRINGRKNGR